MRQKGWLSGTVEIAWRMLSQDAADSHVGELAVNGDRAEVEVEVVDGVEVSLVVGHAQTKPHCDAVVLVFAE